MPRMKVLNSIEQDAFEFPPVFNSAVRKRHFDFPVAIQQNSGRAANANQSTVFSPQVWLLQSDPSILSDPEVPPTRHQPRG